MKNATKVSVVQEKDKPIEKGILAQAIVDISRAANDLNRGGLNKRAIVALIYDSSKPKVSKRTIRIVLEAIRDLERDFCNNAK